jgi:integrase
MSKYKIYQHLDKEDKVLYVGRTTRMDSRQLEHLKATPYSKKIETILEGEAINRTAMILYEQFYINKLKPSENERDNRGDDVSFLKLDLIEFINYPFVRPAPRVKQVMLPTKKYMNEEEFQVFIETFKSKTKTAFRNKLFFEMTYFTKIKPADFATLTWKDIKKVKGEHQLHVPTKGFYVVLPEDIPEKLSKLYTLFNMKKKDYIFKPFSKEAPIQLSYLRRKITEHGKLAGFNFAMNVNLLLKGMTYHQIPIED